MRFARIVFSIAGVWGVLILTPLYFMFDAVGRHYPPPITHPDLYYGFISVTLAWQVAFLVIARDPHRFRPMMIPAIVEKFGFVATLGVLYAQRQLQLSQLLGAGPDLVLGRCFLAAFVMTSDRARTHAG